MAFSVGSQTHAVHICLAMTFTVSHLVCCNIRRTVGSLWRSCVISRRVTHLELSHRADRPLLCLGHLEGRSLVLYIRVGPFQRRKSHLTRWRIFHTLTYRSCSEGSVVECCWWWWGSVTVHTEMCEAVLVILQWFLKGWNNRAERVLSAAQQKCYAKIKWSREKVLSHYLNENYFFSSWFNPAMFKRGFAYSAK